MVKEDEMMMCSSECGKMAVLAALLLALGVFGGAYVLSKGDYSPKVSVSNLTSTPNVYVSSVPPEHPISVSATASQKVSPDLLLIQVRVQTEAQNAKEAQSDNAEVSADLRSKIKALGVKDEDVQTTGYSVDLVQKSIYRCDNNDTEYEYCYYDYIITGYRATQTLTVKVKDLTKGGDVIDAASTAGVNQTFVDYVDFTLQDETRRGIEKLLLKNASVEAKSKAQSIADGLGISLGNVLMASQSFNYYYPESRYYDLYAAEAAPNVPTQLSPGQVDVSATVNVNYEIG